MTVREDIEVRAKASGIRNELRGTRIYGKPIDWDNPDHVIAAAYWLGQKHALDIKHEELAIL